MSLTSFSLTAENITDLKDFLLDSKKDVYGPDERLVIRVPDDAQSLIKLVLRLLNYYDIPTYYVIFASNSDDIVNDVTISVSNNRDTSGTSVLHEGKLIDIAHTSQDDRINKYDRIGAPSPTFCTIPWNSISITSTGTYRPCCLVQNNLNNENGRELNVNSGDSIEDARSSPAMVQLRKDLLRGLKPTQCSVCWDIEDAGGSSKRNLTLFEIEAPNHYDVWTDDKQLLSAVDLKLGNLCNLKCRICDTSSSSTFSKEVLLTMPMSERKGSAVQTDLKNGRWPKLNHFWDDISKHIDSIKLIEFTGGEPFMSPEHFSLLNTIIDKGRADKISLHYNTNGTIFPQEYHMWQHFKQVVVAFSIDDIKERYEYQRSGAKWDLVTENIKLFKKIKQEYNNIKLEICVSVNVYNALYLVELFDWINTQAFDFVFWNIVYQREQCSITSLPQKAKQEITKKIQSSNYSSQLNFIVTAMNHSDTHADSFYADIEEFDSRRNESISRTFPQLYKLIER